MTQEINAAIEGALNGGADRIIVNDSHGRMANILIEELNSRAELISGGPKPFGMMQGMGKEIDRVFLIGYHAASGSRSAVLEHTTSTRIIELSLNGQRMGELGMNAALAGFYGRPVVLVTGDRAAAQEAEALLSDVETVAVKAGITRTSALCLNPLITHPRIREAATRALAIEGSMFRVPAPVTIQVVFHRASHADMAELLPGAARVDGRTVAWSGDDFGEVYKVYRAMSALSSVV